MSESKDSFIVVEDLHKEYLKGTTRVQALRGVDLELPQGDITFIIGPSGSGKSTLLHLLAALDHPSSGRIVIDGQDLGKLEERELSLFRRHRLGIVFQTFNLLTQLTAVENVLMPRVPAGITKEDRDRARMLLEMMGLGERLGHRPNELSGGECQRVAIARALIADPVLLLADEPTGELDTDTGQLIMEYFHKINRETGKTVIVVTHDREIIEPEERILEMRDGQLEPQQPALGPA